MAGCFYFLIIFSVVAFLFLIVLIQRKKVQLEFLIYILIFLIAVLLTKKQMAPNEFQQYITDEESGVKASITGVVTLVKRTDTSVQVQLKNCMLTPSQINQQTPVKCSGVLVTIQNTDCMPGDRVEVTGKVKNFSVMRNPGEFDQKTYYQTLKIVFRCQAQSLIIKSHTSNEIVKALQTLKEKLDGAYDAVCEEKDAGIYKSIVLGEKEDLDQEIKNLYQESGIAHLLSISGLHVAIIGLAFYKFIRRRGLSFAEAAVLGTGLILLYGIMTGNGVSTIRAIVMFVAAMGADVCGRAYDIRSAMALAAILLLVDSPALLKNCGFLLSFGAVFAIVEVAPCVDSLICTDRKKISKRLKITRSKKEKVQLYIRIVAVTFWKLINVSLAINLVTFPVLLYFYYELPLYSVFLNIIVIPLMSLVMISAILCGVTGMYTLRAGLMAAGMGHYILQFYEFLCRSTQKLPFAQIIIGRPSSQSIFLYYLLLFLFCVVQKKVSLKIQKEEETCQDVFQKSKGRKRAFTGILLPMALLVLVLPQKIHPQLQIAMIDVGQGDSVLIRTPSDVTILSDCGSTDIKGLTRYRVIPYLKSQGISSLDYIMVSHTDADHINGIEELLTDSQGIEIHNLLLPNISERDDAYHKLEELAEERNILVSYITAGDQLTVGKLHLDFLHPYPDVSYSSKNASSTVAMLTYGNFSMLFTGDLEAEGEARIIADGRLKDIDVLKTAHHGSANSTMMNFLEIVKPETALISAGINNQYGHPSQELVNRLDQIGADVYLTAQKGCITLYTDGSSLRNETYIVN